MKYLVRTLTLATLLLPQAPNAPADPVRTVMGRLELERYKSHIKGLAQFGDRMRGTQGNRDAIDWLEKQLQSFGYTNVSRQRFISTSGPLENIYATKTGSTTPGEMYIVSAHMDGRGGGEAADDDASGCAVVLELARVLAAADVQTNRSVRFIFWNNEEFGMDGSGTYASERASLQGTTAEPKWLGLIQHDMMMYDHGMPPGSKQAANADINIEYQIEFQNVRRFRETCLSAANSKSFLRNLSFNDRHEYGRHGFHTLPGSCCVRQRSRKREGHGHRPWFKSQSP